MITVDARVEVLVEKAVTREDSKVFEIEVFCM